MPIFIPNELNMEKLMRAELEKVHLLYIKYEECPGKIKLKIELQELCENWLSCTTPSQKYKLQDLQDILRTSLLRCLANSSEEMALDEVGNAFLALAKYAGNLVTQPWRQEFYNIKKYGGYFLQEVGLVLADIEKLMGYMGYELTDNNSFTLNIEFSPTMILQWLPQVALDYTLVATECQLMSRILAAVKISDVSVDMYRLLEYRQCHLGSWEAAVQGLLYEARFFNFASRTQRPGLDDLRSQFEQQQTPPNQLPSDYGTSIQRRDKQVPAGLLINTNETLNFSRPGLLEMMDSSAAPNQFPSRPVPPGLLINPNERMEFSNRPHQFTSDYGSSLYPSRRDKPVPPGLLVNTNETLEYSAPPNQFTSDYGSTYPCRSDKPSLLINPNERTGWVDPYKDFHPPLRSFVTDFYPPVQREVAEHCPHTLPARTDLANDMYSSSFPHTLAEPLMPQQVKWHPHTDTTFGHATVSRSHVATEPNMSSQRVSKPSEEEIFYSDENEEEEGMQKAQQASDPRRYSSAPRKEKLADTDNLTRGRDSWSKLGEAQLQAHTSQEHKKAPREKHLQNGVAAAAKCPTEPKNKGEKMPSQASKSADSRDESWEYVFSKLEIQSPAANQEIEVTQDREKVAKTVAALQLSAPPQLLESAKEIYNRPNELDNRRYQEFIRNAPKIDGVVQHPIVNLSWPERYKYLYYRGEREALVGYPELLATAGEGSKAAPKPAATPPEASEDNTWSCQTCTWLNSESKTICGMCNKSRNLTTAAEPPNPGPQCIQCTLVNTTGRDYCEACGASLDLLYI